MSENSSNKLTTVNTMYARAVILLLAVNFCVTGYFILNITEANQDQLDSTQKQIEAVRSPFVETRTLSSTEEVSTDAKPEVGIAPLKVTREKREK
jgi:hypothetical protein